MSSRRVASADDSVVDGLRVVGEGLGREQVSDIQRARIISAMVDVVAERGCANVTVTHVVARSGVSRRTFYEIFNDREDCFLAALDDAIERIAAHVVPCYERETKWVQKIRAGLVALLEFLDDEGPTGRLAIVETLAAGPQALERRRRVLAQVIAVVDEGRMEVKRVDPPPPLAAEGAVSAVLSIVHARMLEPGSESLLALTGPLMSMVVLPYLGPAAARRELEIPVLARNGKCRPSTANPLKDLEMRLTYRTVRVLMAIGSHPGVSNRRVADAAGVLDQGQISKLLTRLENLRLIENNAFGQAKGESNSWQLTTHGQEIERAIREQTTERR